MLSYFTEQENASRARYTWATTLTGSSDKNYREG